MKAQTDTSTIKEAFEKVLETPIDYEYSWDDFENVEELRKTNEYPKDSEVLSMVNAKRKAAARAAAYQATLKANNIEKPTLATSPQLQLKSIYDGLRAAGKTHEEARSIAATASGIEWA